MTRTGAARWLTLIISLPGRRGTARMRMWRALKAAGAAVLRDGVYLLPATAGARGAFDEQARGVRAAGGTAHVLTLETADREQSREFRALFERGPDYARLLTAIRKLHAQLRRRRMPGAVRRVQLLRRELEALRATDYFPGAAVEQVGAALAELEVITMAMLVPGEPQARKGAIEHRDPKSFRGRTWATRARPWVDRLASAWLIKRFIDPRARLVWLKDVKRCPRNALGFDFDGASFTHVGARVTFETLLASFGLESDPALVRLGGLVHCLDVGGVPVAEAAGIESVLRGMRGQIADDNKLLAGASRIFDHLYSSYQKE
jgi:hypothetical protein